MSAIIQASPVEKLSQEPLPADSFGDAHLYRSRPDVMSQGGPVPRKGTSPGGQDWRKTQSVA
jgi:hypothetical protein